MLADFVRFVFVVCCLCLVFGDWCFVFDVYRLLCVVMCWLLFGVCLLLSYVCSSSIVARCSLFVVLVRCLLFVICGAVLFVVRYLLYVVLLCVVCCLVFVVCCPLLFGGWCLCWGLVVCVVRCVLFVVSSVLVVVMCWFLLFVGLCRLLVFVVCWSMVCLLFLVS